MRGIEFYKKWIMYIKRNINFIKLDDVIKNYSDSIKRYIINDFSDKTLIQGDINFLEEKQNDNNYAKHKDGLSQLHKLINGWLIEDILRILLKDWNAKINGSDIKRKIGILPSNEPDIKCHYKNNSITKKIFIEVTNINLIKKEKIEYLIEKNELKFKKITWWQGRANKYHNLVSLRENDKNKKNEYFLINITDDFSSILIKKIVKNDRAINPKYKWYDYNSSAISLGNEYFVIDSEKLSIPEIISKIKKYILKLVGGDYEA